MIGIRSFGRLGAGRSASNPILAYAVNGLTPETVADFGAVKSDDPLYAYLGAVETFADMFTFTRASAAWMVNSSGNLVQVASGVPRTDSYRYNGTSFVLKGQRLESEQRTNLALHSRDFSQAAWQKNGLTESGGVLTATSSLARIYQDATLTSATNTVFWVEASAGTASFVVLKPVGYDTSPNAWFNLSTGEIGTVESGLSAYMEEVADGRFLCAIVFQTTTDLVGDFRAYIADADNNLNTTIGNTISLFHGQIEAGSVPSSPIITGASQVTRAAETLEIAAAKMSYSSTAMWFQVQGEMDYADTATTFEVVPFRWQSDVSNRIESYINTSSTLTGLLAFRQSEAGVNDAVTTSTTYFSPGLNVPFDLASRNGATYINGAEGGTALTADETPTALPDLSATDFDLAPTFMGYLSLFRQGTGDPEDSGLEELTS